MIRMDSISSISFVYDLGGTVVATIHSLSLQVVVPIVPSQKEFEVRLGVLDTSYLVVAIDEITII
jgi:hypothetical protein